MKVRAQVTNTYFCSGYGDLTEEEFKLHYVPQLNAAISLDPDEFKLVTGDYHGADIMCIEYALRKGIQCNQIAVFLSPKGKCNPVTMGLIKEHTLPNFRGFQSIKERDAVMTAMSGHDIQWERDPKDIKNYDPDYMTKTKLNGIRRTTINAVNEWAWD
jgi:hypothetical protein